MNIKSISELENKDISISQLSSDISYLELDIKNKELEIFQSTKIDFGKFTAQVVEGIFQFNAEFEKNIEYFYNKLLEIEAEVTRRIEAQNIRMTEFMIRAHGEFLHKSKSWRDATEIVYNNKFFKNDTIISGDTSVLSASNIIEGTARRTYYLT